jgi:hypothetical protein
MLVPPVLLELTAMAIQDRPATLAVRVRQALEEPLEQLELPVCREYQEYQARGDGQH